MNDKHEEQITRAAEAERLMNNTLFSGAVVAVKAHLFSTIESSKWLERPLREESYKQMKSLNSVLRILEKEIQTGKLAENQLKKANK